MIIKGDRVILQDDRESDPEDYFRWFNLEEWQYYDQPDHIFQPISQAQFEARAKKNRERYDQQAKDKSKPKPGFHIDTVDGQHLGWVSRTKKSRLTALQYRSAVNLWSVSSFHCPEQHGSMKIWLASPAHPDGSLAKRAP